MEVKKYQITKMNSVKGINRIVNEIKKIDTIFNASIDRTTKILIVECNAPELEIKHENYYKKLEDKSGYIYKPVYGRVGEKIGIKEACEEGEFNKILKEVKWHPKRYLAQKQFVSKPLEGIDGKEYHVCVGSYTVDGKQAGFYARVSNVPRIDSNAADIPVLIEGSVD